MTIEPERLRALADLRVRIQAIKLPDYEMWLAYIRCGGNGDLLSFQAYMHGALNLTDRDWACLQHSVWEAESF